MSYYNTTNLEGSELKNASFIAESQEEIILDYFKQHPDSMYSPCDVWSNLFGTRGNTPITSVRRSITNLTINGDLIKTHQHKSGYYGKKVYLWKLKSDAEKQMDIIINSI